MCDGSAPHTKLQTRSRRFEHAVKADRHHGKWQKNYERVYIRQVIDLLRGEPIVVTGKYKHRERSVWATFSTVRPYVPGHKTRTICDHINLWRETCAPHYALSSTDHNRKFYLLCVGTEYCSHGLTRGGLALLSRQGIVSVCRADPTGIGYNRRR